MVEIRRLDRTKVSAQPMRLKEEIGEPDRIRTCDPLIKSQLLYQLSYGPDQSGGDIDVRRRGQQALRPEMPTFRAGQ